jgi:hypothetical protein
MRRVKPTIVVSALTIVSGVFILGAGCNARGLSSCPVTEIQCGPICENVCDRFGCQVLCYEGCFEVCVEGPGGPRGGGKRDGGSTDGGADADGGGGASGGGLCAPCTRHGDCGDGRCVLYSSRTAACSTPCSAESPCAPGFNCAVVDGTSQCVAAAETCTPPALPCGPERACGLGQACNPSGECVTACASNGECSRANVCTSGGYCEPFAPAVCTDRCAAGSRCRGGKCMPVCLDASDCPSGFACNEGVCADDGDGGTTGVDASDG